MTSNVTVIVLAELELELEAWLAFLFLLFVSLPAVLLSSNVTSFLLFRWRVDQGQRETADGCQEG